jgi:hypothetical protein
LEAVFFCGGIVADRAKQEGRYPPSGKRVMTHSTNITSLSGRVTTGTKVQREQTRPPPSWQRRRSASRLNPPIKSN